MRERDYSYIIDDVICTWLGRLGVGIIESVAVKQPPGCPASARARSDQLSYPRASGSLTDADTYNTLYAGRLRVVGRVRRGCGPCLAISPPAAAQPGPLLEMVSARGYWCGIYHCLCDSRVIAGLCGPAETEQIAVQLGASLGRQSLACGHCQAHGGPCAPRSALVTRFVSCVISI